MSTQSQETFANAWRPNAVEASGMLTEVEGEIPRELHGTLYRNGPCQKVLPKAGFRALHLFDGDALVHAFQFENGQVRHRSRFAQTPSYLREQQEGSYCLGGGNLPADEPLEEPPPAIQPNTNVVYHAGRLFALVENAPPFELDPDSLDSKGFWELDGKLLGMSTTAHPKIDGRTSQMLIHGYQPIEPFIQLYIVEPDGTVSLAETMDAPWPSMMHDFAITENHVIFPLGSLTFDIEVLANGGQFKDALAGRPDLPLKFGIRRREPGSPIRWFDAPSSGYMFHPGNAYERDGRIFMDACTYENAQNLVDSLTTARDGKSVAGFTAHPYLYEFDLTAGTCKETKLSEASAEFPRLDDRLVGHANRWGYAATADPNAEAGVEGIFRRITRYDRERGTSETRKTVAGQWVGEPVFAPRSADSAEDDGFVLVQVYDGASDRTALEILDAKAIEAEPLARIWTQERIPMGFHGNFASADA